MVYFLASILILTLGPLLYRLVRHQPAAVTCLDAFVFVSMAGLLFFSVIPEAVSAGGWGSLLFLLAGLAGPTLMERNVRRLGRESHNAALVLGLLGLCLHAVFDGVVIAHWGIEEGHTLSHAAGHHASEHLPAAVILHRFPVGLTIWWLLRPTYRAVVPLAVICLVAASTALGFFYGPPVTAGFSGQGVAWALALVAGSLLHVVLHRPHLKEGGTCCEHEAAGAPAEPHRHGSAEGEAPGRGVSKARWWAGWGGLAGLLLLAGIFFAELLAVLEGHAHGEGSFAGRFLALSLKSAPALLLAYTMAGLMNAFLPRSSIRWMAGGGSWSQALRGMAVGLPFPICSCGVVPLYRTLVERGAPATSAMAFLIATPELGVDAVLLSIPLLGINMTLLRVVGAAFVALSVGALVGAYAHRHGSRPPEAAGNKVPAGAAIEVDEAEAPWQQRLWAGLRLSFGEGLDKTAPWILLGLAIAAALSPFLRGGGLEQVPPLAQVPLFALAGIPLYVCASGATPLVAVLLFGGVSPGAALAFLLTGPATNVTTFGVLAGLYGKKVATVFAAAMVLLPILVGYATNALFFEWSGTTTPPLHHDAGSTLQSVCLTVLSAAVLLSFLRRGPRRFVSEIIGPQDHPVAAGAHR